MEKYLLYNKKLGYYQGSFMQMTFWSKLECISDHAIAFNSIKDIQDYIMIKFYKELEPYDDYYGKTFDFKIYKIIGCNSNYISLTKL